MNNIFELTNLEELLDRINSNFESAVECAKEAVIKGIAYKPYSDSGVNNFAKRRTLLIGMGEEYGPPFTEQSPRGQMTERNITVFAGHYLLGQISIDTKNKKLNDNIAVKDIDPLRHRLYRDFLAENFEGLTQFEYDIVIKKSDE